MSANDRVLFSQEQCTCWFESIGGLTFDLARSRFLNTHFHCPDSTVTTEYNLSESVHICTRECTLCLCVSHREYTHTEVYILYVVTLRKQ